MNSSDAEPVVGPEPRQSSVSTTAWPGHLHGAFDADRADHGQRRAHRDGDRRVPHPLPRRSPLTSRA